MTPHTGAEAVVAALRQVGAGCAFGLPGTQNLAIVEALRRAGLRFVVPTSEHSAAMMANGYYRASGQPGVLLTIPGPGFTWALTGIAEAALDSAALVHITSAPAKVPGQHFQLQAIDQAEMARPITRKVISIDRADDAFADIIEAWRACRQGEPGPVLVQVAGHAWDEPVSTARPMADAPPAGTPPDLHAVAARLRSAPRCVLLLGQGCADAADAATRLAERLGAVVVTTTSGRGIVSEDHPLSLGFALSSNASSTLNHLIEASDVVLAIGCKFSHNGSRGFRLRVPPEKLVHIDASPAVIGANYPASLAIRGDAHACIKALLNALGPSEPSGGFRPEEIGAWRARCAQEKTRGHLEPAIHGVVDGTPAAFFAALRAALPRASHLVTDSGRHQQLACRYFEVRCPRGLVTPTNLQSMGFGISAAIGAKLAQPTRPVVALMGDGGLAMSGLELLTAVRARLDLTVIVFVDGQYAAIRDQQLVNYGHAPGTEFTGPDCAAFAAAIGARHVRLEGNVESTLGDAVASTGVTIVEVAVGDSLPIRWARIKASAKSRARPLKTWLRAHGHWR